MDNIYIIERELVLGAIDKCVGLVAVMHHRGDVSFSEGESKKRASVWIEQELAIAAFMTEVLGRKIPIALYEQHGIQREGIRDQLLLNPATFSNSNDVLESFCQRIENKSFAPHPSRGFEALLFGYIPAATSGYSSFVAVRNTSSKQTTVAVALLDRATGDCVATAILPNSLPPFQSVTLTSAQIESVLGVSISGTARSTLRFSSSNARIDVRHFVMDPRTGSFSVLP